MTVWVGLLGLIATSTLAPWGRFYYYYFLKNNKISKKEK